MLWDRFGFNMKKELGKNKCGYSGIFYKVIVMEMMVV